MTYTYTVELSEKEKRALEHAVYDIEEWITSAAKSRAQVAVSDIIKKNTEYCNENEIAIPVGELAQVEKAYELGIIQTGYDRLHDHLEKEKKLTEASKRLNRKESIFNLK